jgi:hypothetical protein
MYLAAAATALRRGERLSSEENNGQLISYFSDPIIDCRPHPYRYK